MPDRTKVSAKKPETKKTNIVFQARKTERSQSMSSPASRILFFQKTIGNQAVQRLFKSGAIQAKLRIGQPNDKYEQEADRVADQVMRMPEPRVQRQSEEEEGEEAIQSKPLTEQITPLIQRQVEEEDEEEPVQTKAISEQVMPLVQRQEEEEEELQMKPTARLQSKEEEECLKKKEGQNRSAVVASVIEPSINSLKGGGRQLSKSERDFFEPRFGADFSNIRVHTDGKATETTKAINAQAFTVGNNVVFGKGRYSPESDSGRRLMAHELVHTIQQGRAKVINNIQCDFAVAPTTPNRPVRALSASQIRDAITYNRARHTDANEVALLRDILGLNPNPAVIDSDFVEAVVRYQAQYGLRQDGRIGGDTANRLAREIIAESSFLGTGNLGNLAPEFQLKTNLQTLVNANNRTYADYRNAIRAATMIQRHIALLDIRLLRSIRSRLSWNNFARCVELLGRRAPSYNRLINRRVVQAALRSAWTASNPAVPGSGTTQHEEGGWVYMNLFTGNLSIRRATAGGGAAINLTSPPVVADSIVVAKFHTHPNLGSAWVPGPSGQDATVDASHGVPDIVVGSPGVNPATFNRYPSGPRRRRHLAGNRGLPGSSGGLAPQAKRDGTYDEQ